MKNLTPSWTPPGLPGLALPPVHDRPPATPPAHRREAAACQRPIALKRRIGIVPCRIPSGFPISDPATASSPGFPLLEFNGQTGRASSRERVCQYGWISVVAVSLKKKKNTTLKYKL